MPSERIEADYDKLAQVSQVFDQSHETIQTMLTRVTNCMETLRSDGWIGRGSDAFYEEMSDLVLPQVKRLSEALDLASQVTTQISETVQEAEEQAGNCFMR